MKKICLVASFGLMIALVNANPQGKGHNGGSVPSVSHVSGGLTPGSTHSNAPAGTPAASRDRDKGKDRAEDVGKGKNKRHKKNQNNGKN
jgi:hypothetical protein